MTRKQFGTVRGQCFAVGDTVNYRNRHGQCFAARVVSLFVEQRGLVLVKRDDWHNEEAIDLSDEHEYPYVRIHAAQVA